MKHRAWMAKMWVVALGASLAGCAGVGAPGKDTVIPPVQEAFSSSATFSRIFSATPAQTCEAARRALLSQGYIVAKSSAEEVEGQKSFQPKSDRHVLMNIRVTCVPEAASSGLSMGFVSALQDVYALKVSSNSASLGVSMLGSLSVPLAAGHDSLIKIGSETIAQDSFYEGFFDLMRRHLIVDHPVASGAIPGG